MKNLLFLTLYFLASFAGFSQNDTIFMKAGVVIPVYKVIGYVDNEPFLTFIPKQGEQNQTVDSIFVERFTISNDYSTPEIIYSIEDAYYSLNKTKSEIDYKIGWVQHNLGRFYKQERTSHIFYGASVVSSIVFAANPIKNTAFMYVAAGLGAAGLIIHIDAYKWIKRASIETSLNKVSIKLKL